MGDSPAAPQHLTSTVAARTRRSVSLQRESRRFKPVRRAAAPRHDATAPTPAPNGGSTSARTRITPARIRVTSASIRETSASMRKTSARIRKTSARTRCKSTATRHSALPSPRFPHSPLPQRPGPAPQRGRRSLQEGTANCRFTPKIRRSSSSIFGLHRRQATKMLD